MITHNNLKKLTLPIEPKNTEQLMAEIKILRRKVAQLREAEQRCLQAETTLKAFEERIRILGESAPLGIFTMDTNFTITGMNQKMLEMLSWPSVDDPQSSERRFREQAFRDDLTRLYNRRYLYQSLAGLIENAKTFDFPVSLIFMDLDHFKQVVDTYGIENHGNKTD